MKKIGLILTCLVLCSGCAPRVQTQQTQLQTREFQTRSYETNDVKMVMKALLNVLQDDGYIVKNANVDLGLLTATKEIDIAAKGVVGFLNAMGGKDARYAKNSIVECSGNVTEFGKETRVRINFQTKSMNNKGEVMDVKQVGDPVFYQTFFSKVDKGIFLQKEKL